MQIAIIMNESGNEDAYDNDSGKVRDFFLVPTITISRPSRIFLECIVLQPSKKKKEMKRNENLTEIY